MNIKTIACILICFCTIGCQTPQKPVTEVSFYWQTGNTTVSLLGEVLQRTSIATDHALKIHTAKLSDNAAPADADFLLLDEIEAVKLIAQDPHWYILSRAAYRGIYLYLRDDTRLDSLADLRRTRIGITSNSIDHFFIADALTAAGMDPDNDIRWIDLDEVRILELIAEDDQENWGYLSAIGSSDLSALQESIEDRIESKLVRKEVYVLLVRQTFIDRKEAVVPDFLMAIMDAHLYLAQNFDTAINWLRETDSELPSNPVLKAATAIEPNIRAMMRGHVSLHLSEPVKIAIQRTADRLRGDGSIEQPIDIRAVIDSRYLRQAEETWWSVPDDYPESQ